MLDPRIYRTSLSVVAVAVIVVAFSLGNQPSPLEAKLVPDAFNGTAAYATMGNLAAQISRAPARLVRRPGPRLLRRPGPGGDGLQVQRASFQAQTVDGQRQIDTVTGTLAGLNPGSIVIVAHRDSIHAGAPADLSGTAVLLELAQVLVGPDSAALDRARLDQRVGRRRGSGGARPHAAATG